MRRGNLCAVLTILVLAGCAKSEPFREMVGYVPPTSLPSQPKRTMIQDAPDRVWNNLIASLEQSNFYIDHVDSDKNLIIARYSGDPEFFVDCGSIVVHENGALGQIPGAAEALSLHVRQDNQPVALERDLFLESRIIIRLEGQSFGTVVSTDTTYDMTMTVDGEPSPGSAADFRHEVISFSAGKRAEFTKGTACQPNGALDVAILQNLPNVIGSNEIARADLPVAEAVIEQLPLSDASDRGYGVDADQWTAGRFDDDQLDAAILPQ